MAVAYSCMVWYPYAWFHHQKEFDFNDISGGGKKSYHWAATRAGVSARKIPRWITTGLVRHPMPISFMFRGVGADSPSWWSDYSIQARYCRVAHHHHAAKDINSFLRKTSAADGVRHRHSPAHPHLYGHHHQGRANSKQIDDTLLSLSVIFVCIMPDGRIQKPYPLMRTISLFIDIPQKQAP